MTFEESHGSSAQRLVLSGLIPGVPPHRVYERFTVASELERWWPPQASVEAVVGGELVLEWPSQGWRLRGRFRDLVPGELVAFSWSWDHEPEIPQREVIVRLRPDHDGTRIELTHRTYDAADVSERRGHLEGWRHFLERLAELPPE